MGKSRRRNGIRPWLLAIAMVSALVVGSGGCGPQEEAPTALLTVRTAPDDGVEVKVNGEPRGVSPLTVSGLPQGRAVIEIYDPRYKKEVELVDLPATGETTVTVELTPRVGYVSFESDPPRAEVLLNGEESLGTTPLVEVPVPVGAQNYVLRLENYQDEPGAIEVQEDYIYTKTHELKPKAAKLVVASSPPRSGIWINDQLQSNRTPAEFNLTPGAYRVLVYQKGYLSDEVILDLAPNEERDVLFELKEGNAPPGMVLIPAGEFVMGVDGGSPDEAPKQNVYLEGFYMDRFEVTNRQWKAVYPDHAYEEGKGNFPVTGINYRQAEAYAKAVGKRLPTEREWEKAARGAEGREYPWGNTWDPARCNSSEQRDRGLRPVGTYKTGVSPYGCYDMAGNAYEWTSSWYQPYPGNESITKEYGQIYRVLRGGSFRTGSFDVRCARRYFDNMDSSRNDYGLRLAVDVGSEAQALPQTMVAPGEPAEEVGPAAP